MPLAGAAHLYLAPVAAVPCARDLGTGRDSVPAPVDTGQDVASGSGTSAAAPLGVYSYSDIYAAVKWFFWVTSLLVVVGNRGLLQRRQKKKKKKRLCQKEICAVMSFHNCLGITNYGLSLPLDLCQRTLASIMGVLGVGFFLVKS